jgi:hypothetical protein
MTFMERLSPGVIAALVLVGGFVAGALLVAMDIVLIGVVVAGAAIPVALVAWMLAGDRY